MRSTTLDCDKVSGICEQKSLNFVGSAKFQT